MANLTVSFWYYQGRCAERIKHFLYHYCNLDVAKNCFTTQDSIILRGKHIATYKWLDMFGMEDVPHFSFFAPAEPHMLARVWEQAQALDRDKAVFESALIVPDKTTFSPVETLLAFDPLMVRKLRLHLQCVNNSSEEPDFFTAKVAKNFFPTGTQQWDLDTDSCKEHILFCQFLTRTGINYYYWNKDLSKWLIAKKIGKNS